MAAKDLGGIGSCVFFVFDVLTDFGFVMALEGLPEEDLILSALAWTVFGP